MNHPKEASFTRYLGYDEPDANKETDWEAWCVKIDEAIAEIKAKKQKMETVF